MSNIDKRALREAAERAGQNDWEYVYTSDLSAPGRGYITVGGAEAIYCLNKAAGGVKQSENVLRYIAAASPETMLALLDELEESERLRLKFQEANCELCQRLEAAEKTSAARLGAIDTTHKMFQRERGRAEVAEKRIAELEALARGVKQYSEFQICHYGATEDYAKGYIDCQNNYNKVLFAADGKGEAS
ncbi:ead/Ea22-like family protein [Enterobacter cloacae]|uniref:ead/Ea22-like family protein n=1 Tax=Enterobacter cloacae TaxID=550 RepID=UPI003314D848